jgi:curli biogenesis system outer membrane secretion channel CsgG
MMRGRSISKVTLLVSGLALYLSGLAAQTPAAKPAAAPAKPAAAPAAKPAAGAPAAAKPAAAKPAAPKPAAAKAAVAGLTVDKVVEMKKAGLSDDLILKQVAKLPKGMDLTPDEMLKLKSGNVSDAVINALMDPKLASQPAPAPAVAAAPAPTPEPAPAAVPPAPAAPPAVPASAANQKRVLALNEFEWATVKTVSQEIFKTNVDIGKGIRALLTNRIQKEGKVRLVERAGLQKLLSEQDLGASNRAKKGTGARIGQVIGADAYLLGDIVAFGRDDRDKRVKVGSVVPGAGVFGGLRIGKNTSKAVVVISYRIVDAETSEIIGSGEARGESKRESKGMGGMLGVGGVAAGGGVDMTSSNFAETIIGEATIQACDNLAVIINDKIPSMPKRFVDLESRVALVSGANLTISAGTNDSVAVGDKFEVFKILGEVKDPVTKEVLEFQTQKVGDLVITSVRERIATGGYVGSPAEVGYLVRKVQQ